MTEKIKLEEYAKVIVLRVKVTGLPGTSKMDQGQTNKLLKDTKAKRGHAKVTKSLWADSQLADKMTRIASAARNWLKVNALPGDAPGKYLVPAKVFLKISQVMQRWQEDYEKLAQKFIDNYYSEVARDKAAKANMGQTADYPHISSINPKFHWVFEPMASGDTFTKLFDEEAIASDLMAKFNQHATDVLQEAADVNKGRIVSRLNKAIDSLAAYKGLAKQKLAYNSIKDGLISTAESCLEMNISNDPEVILLCETSREIMQRVPDAEDLKQAEVREKVLNELRKLAGVKVSAPQPAPAPTPEPVAAPAPEPAPVATVEVQQPVDSFDFDPSEF